MHAVLILERGKGENDYDKRGSNRECGAYCNRLISGDIKEVPATTLGSIVIKEALVRAGVAGEQVDEVIMGNVLSAGLGQNPARQAAIKAGLPQEVSALTINKVCGSGLKAVHLATQAILAGDAEIVVAGGFENMSQAPYVLKMLVKASEWATKR